MLAKQFQELLQQVLKKGSHPDGQEKTKMMEVSKGIAQTVTRIARLVENIKGSDWIDPKLQMEMIAENEMKKAAESIERAAQRLAELKLKRDVVVEEHDVENMTFDDLILDSAQSITKCTSALLQAATAAQQELVAQGKIAPSSRQVLHTACPAFF
jgi:talin